MKEDLGIGIAFDIVSGLVELFYYGLLLSDAGYTIEAISKILFGFRK